MSVVDCKVVVAAPVADRAWALPTWYDRLAKQTVRPDQILLVHGGHRGDETWEAIGECCRNTGIPTLRHHDTTPPHPRNDDERFRTLARLRNLMLAWAKVATNADYLLSLDTDIMLDEPQTIEQLIIAIERGADCASPLLNFHPAAGWTCNAGMLGNVNHHPREAVEAGRPEDLGTWPWTRATPDPKAPLQRIDAPMGAVMMSRGVYEHVRYRWHESGEDLGFAINLKLAEKTATWLPWLNARHVWAAHLLDA